MCRQAKKVFFTRGGEVDEPESRAHRPFIHCARRDEPFIRVCARVDPQRLVGRAEHRVKEVHDGGDAFAASSLKRLPRPYGQRGTIEELSPKFAESALRKSALNDVSARTLLEREPISRIKRETRYQGARQRIEHLERHWPAR